MPMPDRNDAAVRVEGLTFGYGAGEVLHGIAFALHAASPRPLDDPELTK